MRVISGSARGRKLLAPAGTDTRPTTDRVKESIFNIISPYLPASNVLDLFSGSGALGIEALSRGCEKAVFVEKDKAAAGIIRQNINLAKVEDRSEFFNGDAFVFLDKTSLKFDIIFLDPPYNQGLLSRSAEIIGKKGLLNDGGIIVAESEHLGEEPDEEFFDIIKRAKYGKTTVFVLRTKT